MAVTGLTVGLNLIVGLVLIALLATYIVYAYRHEQTAAFERAAAMQGADAARHG